MLSFLTQWGISLIPYNLASFIPFWISKKIFIPNFLLKCKYQIMLRLLNVVISSETKWSQEPSPALLEYAGRSPKVISF